MWKLPTVSHTARTKELIFINDIGIFEKFSECKGENASPVLQSTSGVRVEYVGVPVE
jgi:hypothetical protein